MIFPSGYVCTFCGGLFNPYYGGFGHFNLPTGGAGYAWPGFTFPFNVQPLALAHLAALERLTAPGRQDRHAHSIPIAGAAHGLTHGSTPPPGTGIGTSEGAAM